MQVGLLGFGTVGSNFYKLTENRKDINVKYVLSRRPREGLKCIVTPNIDDIINDKEVDIVVEVMGGIDPAYEYLEKALKAKKHVVTANKQLMCAKFNDLLSLASKNKVAIRCTAAAGGGIPWLKNLSDTAKMDEINAVEGILNGTTNYMLSNMTASNVSYDSILKKAQELGYAESDPTADVEGYDARRKIVLSADIAFSVNVKEEDIPCVGISSITAEDIKIMKNKGLIFKLIARAQKDGYSIASFVVPTLFPIASPEANTNGTGNLVSSYAKLIGKQSYSGAGAGGFPTGSNVLRDCLDIYNGVNSFYSDKFIESKIDLSKVKAKWLFKYNGKYEEKVCSAKEAFETYYNNKKKDSASLLARFAEE